MGYSRSPNVGNTIASILERNVKEIPALFGLNPVSQLYAVYCMWAMIGDLPIRVLLRRFFVSEATQAFQSLSSKEYTLKWEFPKIGGPNIVP